MSLSSRLLLCLVFTAGAPALAAPVDSHPAHAQLEAIRTLARTSAPAALARLEALQAQLEADTPYPVRRELLLSEVWLREDVGQLERSYVLQRKVLELALENNDSAFAALGRLGAVRQLIDQNRPAEAELALAQIRASLPKDAPVDVQLAYEITQGEIFNAKAQFDKALASYLRALKLQENDAGDGEGRASTMAHIAQVYINIDNPAQAIDTTRKALLEKDVPVRTAGRLQYTQGIALLRQERGREAIAAFNSALQSATSGGLTSLEAVVRGNIADYFLRQRDYPRAEREARLALTASNRVKDQNLISMANANIGFALMGQGRFAEAAPFVDGVIAGFEKAGSTNDLEAMLDEKGRMQEQAGLFKEALVTVRKQQSVQQTGARAARDRAVAALQEQYEAGQRTRQIELLRRENQVKDADLHNRRMMQILTSCAALLTVLAGAIMFVLYRRSAGSNVKLNALNTQLTYHSTHDALTGLHNRRSFQDKMHSRALQHNARRSDGANSVDCIALMDIDHFKHINDRWGHGVGDAVLVDVARRLSAAVRDSDMVLRWGGEEFMIYAPGADPAYIAEIMTRVLTGIGATPVDAGSSSVPVTLTAGVVTLPVAGSGLDALDWESAIRLADWALYYGKANGRNQARIVTRLCAPVDTVLAALDDATGAATGHLVEMDCVPGPSQPPAEAPAAVSTTPPTSQSSSAINLP